MSNLILFSDSSDKNLFLTRFDRVQRNLYSTKKRNLMQSGQLIHLINLFNDVDKELFIFSEFGKDIGRVSVNVNANHPSIAIFGMIEYPENRKDVLKVLIESVKKWAKLKQKQKVIGPIDLNVWFSNRFNVEEYIPSYSWEPSTPDFYLRDILNLQFSVDKEYHTKFFSDSTLGYERTKKGYDLAISTSHYFEQLDLKDEEKLKELYRLNIASFENNYMYESISFEQYKKTHVAAFINMKMDYSFFIKDTQGAYLGYLFAFLEGDYIAIKSLLINPVSQGMQLSSALVHRALKLARDNGKIKVIGALVRKGNVSDFFFDNVGIPEKVHEYRLVSIDL